MKDDKWTNVVDEMGDAWNDNLVQLTEYARTWESEPGSFARQTAQKFRDQGRLAQLSMAVTTAVVPRILADRYNAGQVVSDFHHIYRNYVRERVGKVDETWREHRNPSDVSIRRASPLTGLPLTATRIPARSTTRPTGGKSPRLTVTTGRMP